MAALDKFHVAVRNALVKDGWTVTDDPLRVEFGETTYSIDLGAEKLIGAERGDVRIAVEIKCFLGPSLIAEFHAALGQYINYKNALEEVEPERTIFLGVFSDAFTALMKQKAVQTAMTKQGLRLLSYSPDLEEILQWTN